MGEMDQAKRDGPGTRGKGLHKGRGHPGPARIATGVRTVKLAGDKLPVPGEDGVWFGHAADYRLAPMEMRLLRLRADGRHYKTAEAEMGISINTVSYHMRSIYQKIQVHSKSRQSRRLCGTG
jgi:DNA-binding CsgD family transcriptional regulator